METSPIRSFLQADVQRSFVFVTASFVFRATILSPAEMGTAPLIISRYEVVENSSTRFAVQSARVLMLVRALLPHVASVKARIMALND